MTPHAAATQPPPLTRAALADELRTLLSGYCDAHDRLLSSGAALQAAMRAAAFRDIDAARESQQQCIEKIAALDSVRRQIVVRAIAAKLLPPGILNPRLSDLARACDEPASAELLALARRLRGLIDETRRRHTGLHAAATGLSLHMKALLRQISQRLSHSGAYSPRGVVDAGGAVVSALDLRM